MLLSKLAFLFLISVGEQNGPCNQEAGSRFGEQDQTIERNKGMYYGVLVRGKAMNRDVATTLAARAFTQRSLSSAACRPEREGKAP